MTVSPAAGAPDAGAHDDGGHVSDDEVRLAAVLALLAISGGEADATGRSTGLGRWRAARLAALAHDPLGPARRGPQPG